MKNISQNLIIHHILHPVSFETNILFISRKNVISLSGDNAIRDQWTCAAQSLLSSFVNVENILRLCRAT